MQLQPTFKVPPPEAIATRAVQISRRCGGVLGDPGQQADAVEQTIDAERSPQGHASRSGPTDASTEFSSQVTVDPSATAPPPAEPVAHVAQDLPSMAAPVQPLEDEGDP